MNPYNWPFKRRNSDSKSNTRISKATSLHFTIKNHFYRFLIFFTNLSYLKSILEYQYLEFIFFDYIHNIYEPI